MRKPIAVVATVALVVAATVGVTACGSDDQDGSSGDSITVSMTSQPDFLDPALSYTLEGTGALWLAYTPLLTYRHEEGDAGSEVIPGLAEDLPRVGDGGTTYRLTLRKGLSYSDGSQVTASDFEHTIKRVLNMESPGAPYFEVIEGASEYLEGGDPDADISGIETNDRTGEITIRLTSPEAAFSNILAMSFGGLVPGDTPFENMTKDPPPGVGAFAITKSEPGREFVLERNPRFDDDTIPEVPVARVERVSVKIVPNLSQQTQDVIDSRIDFMLDPPAADLKGEVLDRFGPDGSEEQRFEEFPTLNTYFFFMNSRTEPFDDKRVREAVNIGIDKPALARVFAGELATGCSFLAPGVPGYTEAIDLEDCPWGDPNQPPDLERARQLLQEAGAEGAEVTVWGNSDEPTPKVTQAYADQLNQIGFDAEPKIINGAVYFQTIGNQETEAQTGFLNWFADFPHPLNFFFLLDGDSIQPTNNQNMSNTDDPRINKELDELRREDDLQAVTDRWEALNDYAVEGAFLAPYGHTKLTAFVSDRIDFQDCVVVHPLYYVDLSRLCLSE